MRYGTIRPGDRFGRLTTLRSIGQIGSGRHVFWRCVCSCRNRKDVRIDHLFHGRVRSCGCLCIERAGKLNFKHGLHGTSEYNVWKMMKQRCHNPKHENYRYYGRRGIFVCSRWRSSFRRFLLDVGSRPSMLHTLDRIDNSKGYKPGNVRWATKQEQLRNTRSNVRLTFNGETATAIEWAERLGLKHSTILSRVRRGWSPEETLTTPMRRFVLSQNVG